MNDWFKSSLSKSGRNDGHSSLVEAVVLAGASALRLEVEGEQELPPGGVQVHRQSDHVLSVLHTFTPETQRYIVLVIWIHSISSDGTMIDCSRKSSAS